MWRRLRACGMRTGRGEATEVEAGVAGAVRGEEWHHM